MSDAAPIFAALGDSNRLRVVSRLCTEGPLSITRLSAGTSISRQAITKHLHVLANAGLVRDRRSGRECIWELEPARLQVAQQYLQRVSQQWDSAIGRLKSFVEE
jgi:DNA-binding transcriptional ArsR family regulator